MALTLPPNNRSKLHVRTILLAVVTGQACVFLIIYLNTIDLANLKTTLFQDFIAYWGAARVLLGGGNPYDVLQLGSVEAAAGLTNHPTIMMWNPPWTIALHLLFALMPWAVVKWVWLLFSLFAFTVCGFGLWRLLAPAADRRYLVGIIITILYMPSLDTLDQGGPGAWLILGITGFLLANRKGHDTASGVALALLFIKPQLTLLFLAGVAWWIVRERRWRVLVGCAAALAAASLAVMAISSEVFRQYFAAAVSPPASFRTATLGAWLRKAFGVGQQWLQFLPTGLGLVLFVIWALRRKGVWNWQQLAPRLLLASTLTAFYGWGYDMVTLLPLVILQVSGLRRLPGYFRAVWICAYCLSQVGLFLLNQFAPDASYYYIFPVALAVLYAWQVNLQHKDTSVRPQEVVG